MPNWKIGCSRLWLARNTPNAHANRVAQLIEEAERRGKPDMVERARARVETTSAAQP
jgi:hypothetical protein